MQKIHGGTPNHSETSLCFTCNCCQRVKGSQLNEDITLCHTRGATPPMRISWNVHYCNDYEDKRIAPLWQMEKIAWKVQVDGQRKFAGFLSPKRWKEKGMDPDD